VSYAIEARDLRKRYGEFEAVRGVSFTVRWGEVFGFLGPNGAGKTTTIMMLTTLVEPTSGEAYVAGYHVVKEKNEVRKNIGIVFQDPTLDSYLTVYENMYVHGKLYGIKGNVLKERIKEALTFFDLWEHRNKVARYLSGGMRRRLELARAMLHEPKVLFLDEPTVGLDPQSRNKVWEYIKTLNKKLGVTVFMTTHYMDEADEMCDRIAIIDHGKIIAEGSPEELKSSVGGALVIVKTKKEAPCPQGFECEKKGDKLIISLKNLGKELIDVIDSLRSYEITELDVRKPTLNEVFLKLTGRELRDEDSNDYLKHIITKRMWG